jgi:hypothetical protein
LIEEEKKLDSWKKFQLAKKTRNGSVGRVYIIGGGSDRVKSVSLKKASKE